MRSQIATHWMQRGKTKLTSMLNASGPFQWAKVKELDMWDRLSSIGALRRVLSSTPISMEFHSLGVLGSLRFPHHLKKRIFTCPIMFLYISFGSCPLLSNISFDVLDLERSTWIYLEQVFVGSSQPKCCRSRFLASRIWHCFATLIRRVIVTLHLTQLSHACCVSKHYFNL